jgi:hypothetical protein
MRPILNNGGLNNKDLPNNNKLKSEWKKHSPLQIEQFYHTPKIEEIVSDAEFYHAYCQTFPSKT